MKNESAQNNVLHKAIEEIEKLTLASSGKSKKKKKSLALVRIFPQLDISSWKKIKDNAILDNWIGLEIDESHLNENALAHLITLSLNSMESVSLPSQLTEPCFVQANEKQFLFFGTE